MLFQNLVKQDICLLIELVKRAFIVDYLRAFRHQNRRRHLRSDTPDSLRHAHSSTLFQAQYTLQKRRSDIHDFIESLVAALDKKRQFDRKRTLRIFGNLPHNFGMSDCVELFALALV